MPALPDMPADSLAMEVGVRSLKKAQDQMTREGEAMIQMVEQAGTTSANPYHLDAYA